MGAPCPLLGNGITDDTLLHIARFLPTARDLLGLQLTCPRFAAKVIAAPSVPSGKGAAAAPELLCIVEAAARRWVAGCSEQERGWVPRRSLESWLGLMHEVAVLRLPLVFGRAHGSFMLTESRAVATRSVNDGYYRTAASKVVMRSGRHFAQFTLLGDSYMRCGVIQPGWDGEEGEAASSAAGHCFYATANGRRFPDAIAWEGMQHAHAPGDRIGMLLDLDRGSMTVWKNDGKMGVMVAEGLSGPLCWAAELVREDDSARIESAPLPQ